MGRDPLDELAAFRSAVPDPRLQPDPAVLSGIVASLRAFRDEAGTLGVPDDFLRTMTEGFVECFCRLDGLPRDDPFWAGTNRRPTGHKMGDFSRKLARDHPEDEAALGMRAAVQVLVGHSFDPETWRKLISAGRATVPGAVYAALVGFHFGGLDTGPEIVRFLGESGRCGEAKIAIDALTRSEVAWVRAWAGAVADGCEGKTR